MIRRAALLAAFFPLSLLRERAGVRALPLLAFPLLLAACAASQAPAAVAPQAPGFWLGLWHGFIFPIAWIVSLFADGIAVYAVPNNGGWYDFGYFVGIVFIGVGARKTKVVTRYRTSDRSRRDGPVVDSYVTDSKE